MVVKGGLHNKQWLRNATRGKGEELYVFGDEIENEESSKEADYWTNEMGDFSSKDYFLL